MNMHGNVCAHSVNVGSALVAGPFALGRRHVDKRRPYTRLHGSSSGRRCRTGDSWHRGASSAAAARNT